MSREQSWVKTNFTISVCTIAVTRDLHYVNIEWRNLKVYYRDFLQLLMQEFAVMVYVHTDWNWQITLT